MQASYAGPLASYNSLEDEHLADYFSNPHIIRHLRKMGLVTRDGEIVSEGVIRRSAAQKEHKARTKNLLAEAIVHNALEIERKRRAALKKKLELLAKIEMVERVKSQKSHPVWVQEFNPHQTPEHASIRPPRRLSAMLDSHSDRLGLSDDQLTDMRRIVGRITKERSVKMRRPSPYEAGQWSSSTTPLPLAPRPPSAPRPHTSMTCQSRRMQLTHQNGRPRTAPVNGHRPLIPRRSQPVRSEVQITLRYTGKNLHLEGSYSSGISEVLVLQQHCGGNTVQLYKGKVRPREQFTFVSKRHLSMPFGLTIYLDGMMDSRVSACCEYRHQCGKLLGSKMAHFRLVKVDGGRPCIKCAAESERKEQKEQLQRSLNEVVNSSPSTENEEELEELLARNGITNSQQSSQTSVHPSKPQEVAIETAEAEPAVQSSDPDDIGEQTRDQEIQATEDAYEDDFAKSESEVSIKSHHSSDTDREDSPIREEHSRASSVREDSPLREEHGSERDDSPIRDEHSRANSHTHSRSPSASSISSLSSDESVQEEQKPSACSSKSSITSSSSSSSSAHSRSEKAQPLNTDNGPNPEPVAVENETTDFGDDVFKEPEVPHNVESQIKSSEEDGSNQPDSPEVVQEDSTAEDEAQEIKPSVEHFAQEGKLSPPNESNDEGSKVSVTKTPDHNIRPIQDSPTETPQHMHTSDNLGKPGTEDSTGDTKPVESEQPTEAAVSSLAEPTLQPESSRNYSALSVQEATAMLEKTPSMATSLSSILNDGNSKTVSSVDLSDQDEDIPKLEKRVIELSNPDLLEAASQQEDLDQEEDMNIGSRTKIDTKGEMTSNVTLQAQEDTVELLASAGPDQAEEDQVSDHPNQASDQTESSTHLPTQSEDVTAPNQGESSQKDELTSPSKDAEAQNKTGTLSLSSSLTSISSQHTES